MSELDIVVVTADRINEVWPQVKPLMERVVKKAPDDMSIYKTRTRLYEGLTLLVTISEGSKIVAINTLTVETLDSGMKILCIPITSGDRMDEWLERFLEVARAIARDHGCEELRGLSVRKGWMKVLAEHGWKESHVIIKCKV